MEPELVENIGGLPEEALFLKKPRHFEGRPSDVAAIPAGAAPA